VEMATRAGVGSYRCRWGGEDEEVPPLLQELARPR
jgi:hypothetical protein